MPIKTDSLASAEVRTFHRDFGDAGDLNIIYFPNKITFDLLSKVRTATDDEEVLPLFFSVVKSWDLEDETGKTLPIGREAYGVFTSDLIKEIISEMSGEDLPKGQTTTP